MKEEIIIKLYFYWLTDWVIKLKVLKIRGASQSRISNKLGDASIARYGAIAVFAFVSKAQSRS